MKLEFIFQKQMFWLTCLVPIIGIIAGSNEPLAINRTVNWNYGFSGTGILIAFISPPFTWLFYLTGYGVLKLLKTNTKYALSIAHFLLLASSSVFAIKFRFGLYSAFVLSAASFIVFWMNIYCSVKANNHKLSTINP